MKLNLKKSRKLENEISKFMETLVFNKTCEVRIKATLEEIQKDLKKEAESLKDKMLLKTKLRTIRYKIREEIGKLNEIKGINKLMIEKNMIEEELSDVNTLLGFEIMESELDIMDKKESLEKKGEDILRRSKTKMDLNVLTKSQKESLENNRLNLKKRLERVEDNLSKKNLGTSITLTKLDKELLSSLKLI